MRGGIKQLLNWCCFYSRPALSLTVVVRMGRYQPALGSQTGGRRWLHLGHREQVLVPSVALKSLLRHSGAGGMWVKPQTGGISAPGSASGHAGCYGDGWLSPVFPPNLGKNRAWAAAMTGKNGERHFDLISCLRLHVTCAAARFVHRCCFQEGWLPSRWPPSAGCSCSHKLLLLLLQDQSFCIYSSVMITQVEIVQIFAICCFLEAFLQKNVINDNRRGGNSKYWHITKG